MGSGVAPTYHSNCPPQMNNTGSSAMRDASTPFQADSSGPSSTCGQGYRPGLLHIVGSRLWVVQKSDGEEDSCTARAISTIAIPRAFSMLTADFLNFPVPRNLEEYVSLNLSYFLGLIGSRPCIIQNEVQVRVLTPEHACRQYEFQVINAAQEEKKLLLPLLRTGQCKTWQFLRHP